MIKMKDYWRLISLGILFCTTQIYSEHPIVTSYVKTALNNNNIIQEVTQKEEASKARFKQSLGNYLPSLSLQSRYSRSEGGRSFSLPLGDIINPVYQTLDFPEESMLDNREINLIPEKEYEAKLSIIQPIFNPLIYLGSQIAKEEISIQKLTKEITKVEIAKAIRLSYYSWILTKESQKVYKLSLEQAKKQLSITEKLNEAGMVTSDAVLAMQSDVLEAEQDLTESSFLEKSVRWNINKILNKPLDESLQYLEPDSLIIKIKSNRVNEDSIINNKIQILKSLNKISSKSKKIEQLKHLPTLALAIDAGILSDDLEFRDDGFINGSLVLQWDLFSGLKRKNRISETNHLLKANEFKLKEEKTDLQKSIRNYLNKLETAKLALIPAEKLLETSELYYDRILNSYKNGTKTASDLSAAHLKLNKAALNLKKKQIDVLLTYSHLISSQDKCF